MQTLKVREKKVSVHTYNYDNIIEFLKKNRSEVYMNNKDTKDYVRKNEFYENAFFE